MQAHWTQEQNANMYAKFELDLLCYELEDALYDFRILCHYAVYVWCDFSSLYVCFQEPVLLESALIDMIYGPSILRKYVYCQVIPESSNSRKYIAGYMYM